MAAMTNEPMQNEPNSNPISHDQSTADRSYIVMNHQSVPNRRTLFSQKTTKRRLLLNAVTLSMSRCNILPVLERNLHFTPIKKTRVY